MAGPDSCHHVVLLSLVAFLSLVLLSSRVYTFQCPASSPQELLQRPAHICKHYLGRKPHFSRHSRIQRLFDIKQTPEGQSPGSFLTFFFPQEAHRAKKQAAPRNHMWEVPNPQSNGTSSGPLRMHPTVRLKSQAWPSLHQSINNRITWKTARVTKQLKDRGGDFTKLFEFLSPMSHYIFIK